MATVSNKISQFGNPPVYDLQSFCLSLTIFAYKGIPNKRDLTLYIITDIADFMIDHVSFNLYLSTCFNVQNEYISQIESDPSDMSQLCSPDLQI